MSQLSYPVRRCHDCDRNWPNIKDYNVCPRCEKCTYASTDDVSPKHVEAKADAARFRSYNDFDRARDAEVAGLGAAWAAEMNALLEATAAPTNYGLAGPPRGDKPRPFGTFDPNA